MPRIRMGAYLDASDFEELLDWVERSDLAWNEVLRRIVHLGLRHARQRRKLPPVEEPISLEEKAS